VKFAGVLGLALGWLGWTELVVGTALGFVFGGVVSIGLLARGRAGRRTRIPYGPHLIAGALTAVLWAVPIAGAYLGFVLG
jgi:leader peptidase (prepilin peptidase)/N-methyltransferase